MHIGKLWRSRERWFGKARFFYSTKVSYIMISLSPYLQIFLATASIGMPSGSLFHLPKIWLLFPDRDTDAAIQRAIRTELNKDTTVITVAHRLHTIMDSDRIVRPWPFMFVGLNWYMFA